MTMRILFSFSVLVLIWSIYYLAMHITGSILTLTDIVVCGAVIIICAAIIIWNVVCLVKGRHLHGKAEDSNV